jgi:beta-glucosidase
MKDSALFRPARELKGFAKIFLKAGEEKKVSIPFDDKTFRVWNRMTDRWEIEGGTYQISVGSSCRDLRLFASVEKQGDLEQLPYDREKCSCYYKADIRGVSDEAYEEILGYPVPCGSWNQKSLGINDALCQMYYAKSPIARKIYKVLDRKLKKSQAEGGVPDLNTMFQYNMPFRAIAKMTGGLVSMEMVKSIVEMVNGHFFRGMGGVIGGFFRNRKENKQYLRKLK